MPSRKSQARAETEKKLKSALKELLKREPKSIQAVATVNKISHLTLLQRMNGGKSTVESCESQQILTIAEENALAEYITRLAIAGHPPKTFIYPRTS